MNRRHFIFFHVSHFLNLHQVHFFLALTLSLSLPLHLSIFTTKWLLAFIHESHGTWMMSKYNRATAHIDASKLNMHEHKFSFIFPFAHLG